VEKKIVADESQKMVGFVQTYTDQNFQAWVLQQPDEFLATKTAFEVWQEYKARMGA
jgi:hypothetical protein